MKCPTCSSLDTKIVYKNLKMPYGVTMIDKIINLTVSYCTSCSFVFQSSAYTNEYDKNIEILYKNYKIVDIYNFPNRNYYNLKALNFVSDSIENTINYNVLEIGSNRGDFLYLLKEKFSNINILGCEPTEFKNLNVPTVNSFFDAQLFNTRFDLIIVRHTLEHIKNPKIFIKELTKIISQKGKVFIEVPNIINSLDNMIEDFTPDHVNYFSSQTLENIFLNYNVLKKDDTELLYTIFEYSSSKKKNNINTNIECLFDNYNEKFLNIKKQIKDYNRIVFYGISNFYLWTYVKLKDDISDKELYVKDDNLLEDKLFGLRFIEEFKQNDLVVLCTSNKKIQERMKENLPSNIDILYPWKGIDSV